MIKIKKKIKMKGFTLVELLAVIVILAIILVIAVPKVMDIINDAKKGTLESSAKMLANQAEKTKIQNAVLGKNEEITCDSIANLNKGDYSSCSIKFENNTALVTIEGSGKFEGLKVCDGTKTDATATEGDCNGSVSGGSSSSGMCLIETEEKIYKNINVDNCVTHLKSVFEEYLGEECAAQRMREYCERKEDYYDEDSEEEYYSIDTYIRWFMEDGYITKEELIEKGVFEEEINKICVTEETPASCFAYEIVKKYKVKDVDACVNYFLDDYLYINEMGEDCKQNEECFNNYKEELRERCQEEDGGYNLTINEDDNMGIRDLIDGFYSWGMIYTEQDLIDNNVIYKDTKEIIITGYDYYSCGRENLIIPATINNINVTKIASGSFGDPTTGEAVKFKTIKIPSTVYEIGENAFNAYYDEYSSTKRIYVDLGNPNAKIGECAFGYLSEIQNHNLPNTYQCE